MIIRTALDAISPVRSKIVHTTEPQWINPSLKRLIGKRQSAFNKGNLEEFRHLRNRVNRERKICRARYYEHKVEHLKEYSQSNWWKEVKRLSGTSGKEDLNILKSLHHLEGVSEMSATDSANFINTRFLTAMENFQPLTSNPLQHESIAGNFTDEIVRMSTFKKLATLNPTKVQGPDAIPGWMLKENADLLAGPICDILNLSYSEGRLPSIWKEADVVPIPKQRPINDANKHIRPISLTPIISKITEDHIVESYVKPAVLKKIDVHQFGTIPKSSTVHALIDMTHQLYVSTDGNGATSRLILFDFREAFDLINHNILVEKLLTYDIPKQIVCWIFDFLMNRRQRVKLANNCYSEWLPVPAGVPQGTKLGPWLFLIMINDLTVPGVEMWKYVDDTSISDIVEKGHPSNIQAAVDSLSRQSISNDFQLNESKCKELKICFAKKQPTIDSVEVNGNSLEVVSSSKILGLIVSNDLKWNAHILKLVKKGSSRLYCLRQLKRSAVAPKELILFYTTCIRSILEYTSPVFHRALPSYLSEDLERLQKRALKMIIYPTLSYAEALSESGLATLYVRREELSCIKGVQ